MAAAGGAGDPVGTASDGEERAIRRVPVSCGRCGTAAPATAKFCPECGERMASAEPLGERRVVTVVFADLSGFTSYSEHTDPERVRALADEAAAGMSEIVRRYGGSVDKVIGDCVMAVFGAPTAHEDDPERAVRASLDMQAFVDDNQDRFAGMPLRIGVNTGEVMFAPVAGELTVIGDTVNTAARLQSAAARGQVVVGAATARAVEHTVELEELEPITAKGKDEPVPLWRALHVHGQRRRTIRRAPLVGREAEVARLLELHDTAQAERRTHLAVVIGEPGVGKTRVIAEIADAVRPDSVVRRGHCLPYGEGITYWPIVEMIREAAGVASGDDLATTATKLGGMLESLGSDDLEAMRTIAGAVSHLLGVPTTPRGTYRVTEISQSELHWGIRRLLEMMAALQPLVVVVEDVHWAEPTLLDLLGAIADEGEGPLLLLCSARPELRDADRGLLGRARNRRVIELDSLDGAAAEELLSRLIGCDDVASAHLLGLLRTVGGNPLFLEETVRMLGDRGLLDRDGRLRADVDVAALSVPENVTAVIDSRLDRLDDLEQRVLGYAAVVGATFTNGDIGAIADDGVDVEEGLRALAQRDLVRHLEDRIHFMHLLVRDAAYNRLPKRRRSELHERCAAALGADDDVIELAAYHLEQACLLGREVERPRLPVLTAVRALMRAAQRAESRQGTAEASRFYERGLALVGDRLPETETELRLRRAQMLAVLGQIDDACSELAWVAGSAVQVDRADLRCRALIDLGQFERASGKREDPRRHVQEAQSIASDLADDLLRVRAAYAMAAIHASIDGDHDAAVSELRQALARAQQLDDAVVQAHGYLQLGVLLFNAGRLAEAEEAMAECAAIGRREGGVRYQALATSFLGTIKAYRGPRDEAESLLRQSLTWLKRTNDRYVEAQACRTLALLRLGAGDTTEAASLLAEAAILAERYGGWLVAAVHWSLAELHALEGRTAEAVIAAATARSAASADDPSAHAKAWMAEAAVAVAMRDTEIANEAFATAIELLGQKSLPIDIAEARLSAGAALARLGDWDSARAMLEQAREIFEGVGAGASVAEVDEALLLISAVA